METRTVDDFFDNEYLAYANYVLTSRAIPSVIDGFKPAQRKIAFAANKLWKSGNEKPMKVFQLGGQAAALSFFHHGSLDGTIIGMTQEFKNSMSIFQGIGQFGSLRSPEAGAPRYVGVKFNENFRRLYKDFELATPQYEEGEEIEPKFFLPIIPTVLLNGGSGIAVGFATNILNRHPLDLIEACIDVISERPISSGIKPFINGFFGAVEPVAGTDKTWVFKGMFTIKNTSTVEITEIPPSFTYQKYEALLDALQDRGVIHSYEDFSSDRVRYVLKFPRQGLSDLLEKEKLSDALKMREQETENLTTLDENGKLKVFDKPEDLIHYFVRIRLEYYARRKEHLLKELDREINILNGKSKFVEAVVSGKIIVANAKKADLLRRIEELGIEKSDGGHDYLLSMPIYTLTHEKYEDLKEKLKGKVLDRKKVEDTAPKEFYLEDLQELKRQLKGVKKEASPPPTVSAKADSDILDMFGGE